MTTDNTEGLGNRFKRIEALLARAQARAAALDAGGLWQAIQGRNSGAAAQKAPNTQTTPNGTIVAAMSLFPRVSGLFEVSVCVHFSCSVTGQVVTHDLFSKQGATTGVLAGGAATGKSSADEGAGASSSMILNVDAAGGGGLTFEGSSAFTLVQNDQSAATLTNLLTGQGIGTMEYTSGAMLVDATGPTSETLTPFTIGLPMCLALGVTSVVGANVITYQSITFWARELPRS